MDILENWENHTYLLSEKPPKILEIACSEVYVNQKSFHKDELKAADVVDSDRVLISKLKTSGCGYYTFSLGIISRDHFESREKLDDLYSFEWRLSTASFPGKKGIFFEKIQFQELLKDVFHIKMKTNLDHYLSNRDEMRRDLGRDIIEGESVSFKKLKEELFFKLSLKIFGNEDDDEETAKSAVILRDFRVLFDDDTEVFATARRGAHYLIMHSMRC